MGKMKSEVMALLDNKTSYRTRQNNYDLLRIISTIAVVVLHVNFTVCSENYSFSDFNICSFINVITRFSVPCFVMLSGAFNLSNKKNIELKAFYSKSFYKICIPLIIFTFISLLLSEISAFTSKESFIEPILNVLKGDFNNYWFMFMLLALYALTPFLLIIKNSISNKKWVAMSVCLAIFAFISQISSTYQVAYSLGVVFSYLSYYCIGNVLYEYSKMIKFKWIWLLLSIILFVITYIFRALFDIGLFILGQYVSFFSPLVILGSYSLFLFFSKIEVKMSFEKISSVTLFIYLFHTKVYLLILKVIETLLPQFFGFKYIIVFAISFVTFIISWLLSVLYKRIWNYLERKYNWREKWNALWVRKV